MEIKSNFNLKGRYRIMAFKAGEYKKWLDSLKGFRLPTQAPIPLSISPWIENLIVNNNDHGLNLIIQRLAGEVTYDIDIANASIGTGTNAPSANDTDLQTPVLTNILLARISNTLSTVTAEFFMTDAELADGTYKEFGVFVNSLNKKLFARSLITPNHVKSAGEDTLVEYEFTGSAS